jgi:Uncharacterized protein conserved in bacteria
MVMFMKASTSKENVKDTVYIPFPTVKDTTASGFRTSSMARVSIILMNNNRYDGLWYQDYQHGKGNMYYYNGNLYEGDWVNDKREGQGTYTWKKRY